jgi:hypothetical protein
MIAQPTLTLATTLTRTILLTGGCLPPTLLGASRQGYRFRIGHITHTPVPGAAPARTPAGSGPRRGLRRAGGEPGWPYSGPFIAPARHDKTFLEPSLMRQWILRYNGRPC